MLVRIFRLCTMQSNPYDVGGNAASSPASGQEGAPTQAPIAPGSVPGMLPGMMPFFSNISSLSEVSGIPSHLLNNPAMVLAAQQIAAQRFIQHQYLTGQMTGAYGHAVAPQASAPAPRAAPTATQHPASGPSSLVAPQGHAKQHTTADPAPLHAPAARPATGATGPAQPHATISHDPQPGAGPAAPTPKPEGSPPSIPGQGPTPPQAIDGDAASSSPRVDPGGRLVWAKVGAYPWWPAKVLTQGRDLSFPAGEEPPRPNAVPVRFFGTHDFSWIGSKRALVDWEEVRLVLGWPGAGARLR